MSSNLNQEETMSYLSLILIPLNLLAIGLYMRARIKGDLGSVIIYQPGAVIISWSIAAAEMVWIEVSPIS